MTASGWIALAMAVFGAFSYGVGSILQAIGAMRSTGTVRTLGHPLYLLGVGCDLLAWAASMVALRELAVYQVQSVLAGSLAVTVVAARLILASRLRRRDVAAVMVTIGALTVLAMSAGPQEPVPPTGPLRFGFWVAAVLLAVVGYVAARVAPPGVVAALAGTAFGGAALCGRALPMPTESPNAVAFVLALLMEPFTAALVIFAATGMLLYTNALRNGQVGPVTAVLWIGEVIAPSAVGLLVLGDTVRPGWNLAATAAGLITIGAAVVLASAPATDTTDAATHAATHAGHPAYAGQPAHAAHAPHPAYAGQPAHAGYAGHTWAPAAPVLPARRAAHAGLPAHAAHGRASVVPAAPVPRQGAAIGVARVPMWPSVAWHEPSRQEPYWRRSTDVQPFTDQQVTATRWWGPPVTDRQAGTFWWWGPQADPQLIWIPPDQSRRPLWR